MQGPLDARDDGVLLDVEVTPSADRDAFPSGYNPWRERVEARVRARAEDGEANRALCDLVAKTLGVDAAQVGIEHGHTSRRKTIVVRGPTREDVEAALGDVLDA